MDRDPIGRQTPIHVSKYDGRYYRRWPVYYVMRRGPLYVAQGRAGESVHATPDPADDPAPAPITWDSDVYLYDDRFYSVIRARRDGRIQYYVNLGTPVLAMSVRGMLAMKEQFPHLRNGRPWRQKDIADMELLRGLAQA